MRCLVNARNRTIAVANGKIVRPAGRFDIVVDALDADIRPGLINAHDHLHRNHYGRLGEPPYRNAGHWAGDIQSRYRRRIAEGRRRSRREALLAGAWKNLFAGVTTVVHHDPWEADFDRHFPLQVVPVRSADSVHNADNLDRIDRGRPYCLHVAEGTDSGAAEEVHELYDRGLLTSQLIAVHGVGFDTGGIERFVASGAALVWCPTSNMFLFGKTAPQALLQSGVDVLLGSDSLLTGKGNLLDEIRFARAQGSLSDAQLEDAVGATPARRLGLPVPSLEIGADANLVLLEKPLLEAGTDDIALVMVDGLPRLAKPDLVPSLQQFAQDGEQITVGSVTRWANLRTQRDSTGEMHV
ncbi:MAG TPA: amidohydrolase family protein [Sphingomicrobium sp.]|nr:amidohydrolase family protein [Sphingomicrobium sp.]